ncbi:MAG: hypothetical protein R3C03_00045 [Pirellulaceae bacterium]
MKVTILDAECGIPAARLRFEPEHPSDQCTLEQIAPDVTALEHDPEPTRWSY